MPLPLLENWADTRYSLHEAVSILGEVRYAIADPEPHDLHLGLDVFPKGITTNNLFLFGEVKLDLTNLTLSYVPELTEPVAISLDGHSQRSLAEAVVEAVKRDGANLPLDIDHVGHTEPFHISAEQAAEFNTVLNEIMKPIKTLQNKVISGMTTPKLWPQSMDVMFHIFPTPDTSANAPFIEVGFTPAREGFYDRPFFYAYSDPTPEEIFNTELPGPAYWYYEDWAGLMLIYDDLVYEEDPADTIENTLLAYYNIVSPHLS